LCIVNEWIQDNPENARAYFDRHFVWMKIGEPLRALRALDKEIELKRDMVSWRDACIEIRATPALMSAWPRRFI
jgi:hypothetical protein